jgi:hypothetical protein
VSAPSSTTSKLTFGITFALILSSVLDLMLLIGNLILVHKLEKIRRVNLEKLKTSPNKIISGGINNNELQLNAEI